MWNKLQQLNAEIIVPLKHFGLKISGPLTDDTVLKGIIYRGGEWEPHVTSYISCILKEGDTFIDIGANLGYFTLLGSRLVGKSGKVLAFEPLSINLEFIEQNLKLNNLDTDSNVAYFKYGLWNEEITKEVSFNNNLGHTHITSPDRPEYNQWQKEIIHCIPLDSFNYPDLGKIKLIKMDIEGAEPFALMGMRRTIKEHRPIMVIELNRDCLRKYFKVDSDLIWNQLKELGYEIYTFFEDKPITKMLTLEQLNSVCPANYLIDLIALPQ
ncbi:MAG: FkbM family methyltransferase [Eubacteriales bacterium]